MRWGITVLLVGLLGVVPAIGGAQSAGDSANGQRAADAGKQATGYATLGVASASFRTKYQRESLRTPTFSAGVFLTRRVSVEAELVRGGAFPPHVYAGGSVVGGAVDAKTPSSVLERFFALGSQEDRVRMGSTFAVSAGYHPSAGGRVRPALRAGISLRQIHWHRTGNSVEVMPDLETYALHPFTTSLSRLQAQLLLGVDVPIEIVPHFAVVPQLRFEVGAYGDNVEGVVRPGIGVRLTF